jgi:hypothetical protein
MTRHQKLLEVQQELKRFTKKLETAIKNDNLKSEDWSGRSNKAFASVKRSALDLKDELTKITRG